MRRRLLWVFAAFGIGASLTWYFRVSIFHYLFATAGQELSPTGLPIFTAPTNMFTVSMNLTIKGGVAAVVPVVVFQLYRLSPRWLEPQQHRFLGLFLVAMGLFYLGGVAFAYFVVLPAGMRFMLAFGEGIATPMIEIKEYLDVSLALLFWMGVVFQLPLAMLLLAKLDIVDYRKFKRFRRHFLVAAFVLSMFITPTVDPINQTLVAVPLIVLYEVGGRLAWLARPRTAM